MTLRLILVGLVAALGLSIPQWTNPKNPGGSTQAAKVTRWQGRGNGTGRAGSADRRVVQNPAAPNPNKRFQPIGYGSGVVRPSSKGIANFWQIPSGPRSVRTAPPSVAKVVGRRFEPIRVDDAIDTGLAATLNRGSEGLSIEVVGPPARLKPTRVAARPIEVGDDLDCGLAMLLNRQAEGLERVVVAKRTPTSESRPLRPIEPGIGVYAALSAIVEKSGRVEMIATAIRPVTATAPRGLRVSDISAIVADLGRQVTETARGLGNIAGSLRSGIARTAERAQKQTRKAVAVVAAEAPKVEYAALPDDVFAIEHREPIADRVAESSSLASLPDDVFAPEAPVPAQAPAQVVARAAEPADLPALPDDVFAPDAGISEQIAANLPVADEAAPENALARTPSADSARTKPVAEIAASSVGGKSTAGENRVPARVTGNNQGPDTLNKAVSLTRDAAFAWMKLLSGPAVVTLTR